MTMNKKILSFIEVFAIYTLWIAAVFDPIGMMGGWRYTALLLVFLVLLIRLIRQDMVLRMDGYYFLYFVFFVLFLPAYGLIVSLLRGGVGDEFIDTSYIAAGVLFFCSLIYLKNDLISVGLRAQILALRLLSLAIVFSLIVYIQDFPLDWIYFFVMNGVAYFGTRTYGDVNFYYIYFIASPMIIFLMVYEAWRFIDKPSLRGVAFLTLPIVALFASGTRFNMLMAVFGVPVLILWRKCRWALIIFGLPIAVILYVDSNTLGNDVIESMMDVNDVGISTKIGYLGAYAEIFSNPVTIIFGQGFNAHVWSKEFSSMVTGEDGARPSKTELTYIEFFRVFGVFVGMVFISIILLMIKRLNKCDSSNRWLGFAVFMYMLVSATNPYIFSTNGMLTLGLCAAILQRHALSRKNRISGF